MKKIIALFAIVSLGFVACDQAKDAADAATDAVETEDDAAGDAAGDVMDAAEEMADSTAAAAGDAVDATVEGVKEATGH